MIPSHQANRFHGGNQYIFHARSHYVNHVGCNHLAMSKIPAFGDTWSYVISVMHATYLQCTTMGDAAFLKFRACACCSTRSSGSQDLGVSSWSGHFISWNCFTWSSSWKNHISPLNDGYHTNPLCINTLRPKQNGRYFADDTFKCIFLNENAWISLKISLKFVPKVRINNIPGLVQIMAWRRPGDKPLSEPMMVSLLTHICVTRPQWVKSRQFDGLLNSFFRPKWKPRIAGILWGYLPSDRFPWQSAGN